MEISEGNAVKQLLNELRNSGIQQDAYIAVPKAFVEELLESGTGF